MDYIKVIFIGLEWTMILGVAMFAFLTNWSSEIAHGSAWMFQTLIVLMAICAVIFQKEQQSIKWSGDNDWLTE